jgi:hypothetical protein
MRADPDLLDHKSTLVRPAGHGSLFVVAVKATCHFGIAGRTPTPDSSSLLRPAEVTALQRLRQKVISTHHATRVYLAVSCYAAFA